jgi:formylglycine-generating enzyme required for sulfatase activity
LPRLTSFGHLSQRELAKQLAGQLAGEFDATGLNKVGLPTFVHRDLALRFVYLPGGQFTFGLSQVEESSARAISATPPVTFSELRPARRRAVKPFLISATPASIEVAARIGIKPERAPRGRATHVAWTDINSAERGASHVSLSLPSEVEWEYACRAGSRTLFCWGNRLPPESELAPWMTDDTNELRAQNAFGLSLLFSGEWCSDYWTPSHEAKMQHSPKSPRVVRGGGAYFWPWQAEEWVWCMSAMRTSSATLPDGRCAFRLCKRLAAL